MPKKKVKKCLDGLEDVCKVIGDFRNVKEFKNRLKEGKIVKDKKQVSLKLGDVLKSWPELHPEEGDILIRHVLHKMNVRYVLERRVTPTGDEFTVVRVVNGDNPGAWEPMSYEVILSGVSPGGVHLLYTEDDMV